jgi:hypothetical protein
MNPARCALGLAAALALGACLSLPNDTRPRGIETAKRTEGGADGCGLGAYRVYRPTPHKDKDKEAPYDAVIPPDYDTPSRVPSSCKRLPD